MARWTPAPIVGGAYSDDTKPYSAQDTVNYIPVMTEANGTRSVSMLRGAPGMKAYQNIGPGPIRDAHDAEGRFFVVSGRTLYQVTAAGVGIALGTIPGVGRVSITHNQIAGGNEVVIANGQSGYVFNTVTSAFTQITDPGFPGAKAVAFLDGYIMFVEPAGRYWGHSDLAAATEYNTLDRAEAESQPDRIVGGIVNNGEWIVLGERTIEFYGNTGGATGTFQRSGTPISTGCAGTFAVAQVDNTVILLGHDGIVYRLNGYSLVRISTHPIEQAISRFNIAQCFATVYEDRGHKIVYFTFPDGLTFGYDVASGEWHRRQSKGLNRWRLNTLTRWNGMWIGGDYSAPGGGINTPVNAAFTTATTGGSLASGTSYSYRVSALNANGETLASTATSIAIAAALATPVNAAFTTATTGGTLAAATYSYRVAAKNAIGRTLASTATTITTTGTTSTVTVNWGAVSGATGYDVFGRVGGTELLIASVGAVTTYTDTGSITPAGALPASNTTATATNTVGVNWGAVTGATGYRVFGRMAGSELLLASVGAVTTYTDTGSITPAGALPLADSTASACKLYRLDWDVNNEDGQELEARRITGVLHDNQNPLTVNAVELVFDTGRGE